MSTAATMKLPPGTDLSKIPSAKAPPGWKSNLIDPPTNEDAVVAVNATLMAVAFIFVLSRIWMNFFKNRKLGWDDCIVVVGLLCAYFFSSLNFYTARYSRHLWDIPVSWFDPAYQKKTALENFALPITMFFTKTAIFGWYLHIFFVHETMQYLIYGGIAFTFCIYFPSIPLTAWFCAPHVGHAWSAAAGAKCPDILPWVVAQAVLTVVLDAFIFLLPMPILFKLNLTNRRKLGVLSVFATAILGVTAAIVACYFRFKLWKAGNYDATWYASWTFILSSIEMYVAIIVACMPTFASFMKTYVGDSVYYIRSRLQRSTRHSIESDERHKPRDEKLQV